MERTWEFGDQSHMKSKRGPLTVLKTGFKYMKWEFSPTLISPLIMFNVAIEG